MTSPLRRNAGLLWSSAINLAVLSAFTIACGPAIQKAKRLSVTGAGSSLERVTSDPVSEMHPALSPDGNILLFEVRVQSEGSNGMNETQNTLVAVNPKTRAERTLYTSTNSFSNEPAWLPDQSSYIYASNSPGQWSIVRALTASPNAAINVIASGDIAPDPHWPTVSPDGRRIAFSVSIRGEDQIAVVGLDGSRFTLLSQGRQPSWSPKGDQISFVRDVNTVSQIFLVNADSGTGLVQLTSGEFDCLDPYWSPDGRLIVFSTNRGWKKYARGISIHISNLYAINPDGTSLTQLTDGDAMNMNPHWGRDGWIYFSSDQSGNFDIWRLLPGAFYGNITSAPVPAPTVIPADPNAATPAYTTPVPPPTEAPAQPSDTSESVGCFKDIDCKGDRICVKGACVNP
jgi:Tol biopolymer transport system component